MKWLRPTSWSRKQRCWQAGRQAGVSHAAAVTKQKNTVAVCFIEIIQQETAHLICTGRHPGWLDSNDLDLVNMQLVLSISRPLILHMVRGRRGGTDMPFSVSSLDQYILLISWKPRRKFLNLWEHQSLELAKNGKQKRRDACIVIPWLGRCQIL